jgi:aminoglycoside 6-adenylyltransferase
VSYVSDCYEQILRRFVAWAESVPDLRAAVVIGSRARTDHPADDWSDLDLVFFTTSPQTYLADTAWLDVLGPHWVTFLEYSPEGEARERRVMFEGALDVDLIPLPVEAQAGFMRPGPGDLDFVRRGFRIVLDKDGTLAANAQPLPPLAPAALPDEQTFLNLVNDFWYHTIWTAKKLRRGEWWTAQGCVDHYLKRQGVLPMITWHAQAAHGADYDTWLGGRFLDEWADPRVVEGLRGAFAHYERDDLWHALFKTMDLFGWLAAETAHTLGYPYPAPAVEQVRTWVSRCWVEEEHDER